ncbi:Crp/Fnr family transcriptional regulator [Variovorax sp. KK3]|uniref:Crp/Fnr family transcriptional regulator n=1 Tax=Variovorax sp. KK3 TaxID=1855728 RepID=UPI00097C8271|nr:Crp/Fnr family transcriptional regulator [Variovorax sp. KK3]
MSSDAQDRLPQHLLDAIAPHGLTRGFAANAILINEGDTTDSLYILLSGRVKIYASSDDGRELVLSEYGPGDYFGELSIDGERRSASIKAMEPCSCRVVQGSELRQFLAEHPDFAMHLTRKLIRMVRRLTEQVRSMALQDVYGRMVRVLTELSEPAGEERLLRHKLTQQDIADRVGASREMVNRVMKELTAGGYMGQREGRLVILRKLPAAW